ncbi:hypothetical protein [Dokdonella immobilis]|uniref:hypothetical protein n=1 Tax=Dokdonella immobilis TaxID=578942 RepID=UPI001587E332
MIYVARVTGKTTDGGYFRDPEFRNRGDCIYAWRGGRYDLRKDARFHNHPGDLVHDLSAPPAYRRANTLLSTDFRYFGSMGTDKYKRLFPRVARRVASLGRGHRVNHGLALEQELRDLIDWAFTFSSVVPEWSRDDSSQCGTCGPQRPKRSPVSRGTY